MLQESTLPVVFFCFAGASSLLGWNTVLSFTHVFDCNLFGGRTWAGAGWPFWAPVAYSAALNVIGGCLSNQTLASWFSISFRICAGCLFMAAGLFGLLGCALLLRFEDEDEDFGLEVGLVYVTMLAVGAAVFQATIFGLAGAVSPRLMQAVMTGQGIAGLICAALGSVCGNSRSGLLFSFLFSAIFILSSIPYFCVIQYNPHIAPILEPFDDDGGAEDWSEAPSTCSVQPSTSSRSRMEPGVGHLSSPLLGEAASSPRSSGDDFDRNRSPRLERAGSAQSSASRTSLKRSSSAILRENAWPQALTICLVFTVTFCLFPGVTARWLPAENVALLIATFQLFDTLGRACLRVHALRLQDGNMVSVLTVGRCLFVPVFMLVQRSNIAWTRSPLVQFPLMMTFALSNGYLSTASMMLGPDQRGLLPGEQQPVGTLMSFFMCLGILLGSLLALTTQYGLSRVATC